MPDSQEAAQKLIDALEKLLGPNVPEGPELGEPKTREEAQAFMNKLEEGCEDVTIGDQAADIMLLVTAMVHSGQMLKQPVHTATAMLEILSMVGAIASMCNSLNKLHVLAAGAVKELADNQIMLAERIAQLEDDKGKTEQDPTQLDLTDAAE